MAPIATVLIPTHDHGPLVRLSVESALAQTVSDVEVFVVGDGVPDLTREVVGELADRDERVRFFDNLKGPRHGEIHRHAALSEASGSAVLYLSDDDLWFPDHVETMLETIHENAVDLAAAVCLKAYPDGRVMVRAHDVSRYRDAFLRGDPVPGIPLSCAGHTAAAYRALPHGWRTTPEGIATDRYMWQQVLADPANRVGSTTRLTVISLASAPRASMTIAERLVEMRSWHERVRDPARRAEIYAEALVFMTERCDRLRLKQGQDRAKIRRLRSKLRAERDRKRRTGGVRSLVGRLVALRMRR
jgi:GalNAc5-diNAcBac-PP-undecaprenol beta-1,3-glucosyltransferase